MIFEVFSGVGSPYAFDVGSAVEISERTGERVEVLSGGASIGWVHRSDGVTEAELDLTGLTAGGYGWIASGSGTSYTLESGHTIAEGDEVLLRDVSAGSDLGSRTVVSVTGNDIELSASITLAAGDQVTANAGATLKIGDGLDIVPGPDCRAWITGSALRTEGEYAFAPSLIDMSAADVARISSLDLSALADVTWPVSPSAGDGCAIGHYDTTQPDGHGGGVIASTLGATKNGGLIANAIDSPSDVVSGLVGSPTGTDTDVQIWYGCLAVDAQAQIYQSGGCGNGSFTDVRPVVRALYITRTNADFEAETGLLLYSRSCVSDWKRIHVRASLLP